MGGHRGYNGYTVPAGAAAAPQETDFYGDARAAGYKIAVIDSPFKWNVWSIDADTGEPITGARCPAYGLVDESQYGLDDSLYTTQRDEIAAWVGAIQPESLSFDVEAFKQGAAIALENDPNHPHGCMRCNDYLDDLRVRLGDPNVTMAQALVQMGVDRTLDVRNAMVAAGASPLPEMGYYQTRARFSYHDVWNLEALVDAGAAEVGFPRLYSPPRIIGPLFRQYHQEALDDGLSFYPIMRPSQLMPGDRPETVYDKVNELLGSGARGVVWWPFDYTVGADLYYFAKALEGILPVESFLVNSSPVSGVTAAITDPSVPDPALYAVEATAVKSGSDYIIRISSYGRSTINEDPPWIGEVKVTLPDDSVGGTPIRLADGTNAGTATNGEVVIDFAPGVEGARTALFHLCDTSQSSCTEPDGDGDGYRDDIDNCPTDANPDQVDLDSDGIGDVCDNCSEVPNGPDEAPNDQCDTDSDGYGNACDGDFNDDNYVNGADTMIFFAEWGKSVPPGDPDVDMDCDANIGGSDFLLFIPQYGQQPGPSCGNPRGTPCP